jgi:hypothetical protein
MTAGVVASAAGDSQAAETAFREAIGLQRATLFSEEDVTRMLGAYAGLPGAGPALDLYRRLR